MKKISKEEIQKAAQMMADCFCDYPLYRAFFPDEAKRPQQLLYFCWYYIYVRQKFTYFSEDRTMLLCIQKPGERMRNPLGLLLNPRFLLGAARHLPLSCLLMLPGYGRLARQERLQYFHPDTDWFVHLLAIQQKARGSSRLLNLFHEMDEGAPLFCLTHLPRNVRLYKLLGFQLLQETPWKELTVYTLRREEKH